MPSVTHGIQWACRVIALTLGLRHQRVVQRDVILAEAASLARSMLPDFLQEIGKLSALGKQEQEKGRSQAQSLLSSISLRNPWAKERNEQPCHLFR